MTFCVMALLVMTQPPQPDPHVALELGRLKGTWRIVSISEDGKANDRAYENVRFKFNDNVMTMTDKTGTPLKRGDGKPEERVFVLNLNSTPKAIDLTISNKFQSLGIYDLSGDELKLCTAEPGTARPSEFKSKLGVALVVLKRDTK
jgi:uncharacterized protein (TIGR03067 family)